MTQLIGASGKEYNESPQFLAWVKLVFDRDNKKTFGNFTQAALAAYGLNGDNQTDYNSAAIIGHKNYKKVNDLASIYLQKKNVSFGLMMDALLAKMAASPSLDSWNVIMDLMGYDRPNKNQIQFNQNVQQNFIQINEQQLTTINEQAGLDQLGEEELVNVLIKGEIRGEGEISSESIHNRELPGKTSSK